MLKAYMIHDGEPSEGCTLVFHESVNKAKCLAMNAGWYEDYTMMRGRRESSFDNIANIKNGKPWYAEGNDELPEGRQFFNDRPWRPDDTM